MEAERAGTHYIWRTRGDGKVRPEHAANNGKIFAWDSPPSTGHPGEDYNCRCIAEPYVEGESEFAYQDLTEDIPNKLIKWQTLKFIYHYLVGGGQAVDLAKTGNLRSLIDFYSYKIIVNGKNSSERLKAQIIDEARQRPSGKFTYAFSKSYNFDDYVNGFGDSTVSGQFTGTVRHENGLMSIEGKIDFLFDDTFTDVFSEREKAIGTSDPRAATPEMLRQTEYVGKHYKITGQWSTNFKAAAKLNENTSRYVWD